MIACTLSCALPSCFATNKKMKDLTLLVAFCLNIGVSFSRSAAPNSCRETIHGACGRGQYVIFSEGLGHKCEDCPKDTYMDLSSHGCESCRKHTQPNLKEVVVMNGDSTADAVFICIQGFFRARDFISGAKGDCERCEVCGDGFWSARECTADENTLCCPFGYIAAFERATGRHTCAFHESRLFYQPHTARKERSAGSSESNPSGTNPDTAGNSGGQRLEGDSQSTPDHGHSRSDSESQQSKSDFPVWARILCAGVAIGVFLFYLGVGIPCNACGSRDKLRALRIWLFKRHNPVPTEEDPKEETKGELKGESKEKPEEKLNSTTDPV